MQNRALQSTTFPCNFMLVSALNPCPCGYRNDPRRNCQRSVTQIERYCTNLCEPLHIPGCGGLVIFIVNPIGKTRRCLTYR